LVRSGKLTAEEFRPVPTHGGHLAICGALLVGIYVLGALRWWLLLRALGFAVPRLRALHLGLVGVFFNSVGIGYVGGDVVKAYYAACDQPRGRRAEAVTSVIFDRLVGLFSLLLFAVLMMLLRPDAIWFHPPDDRLRLAGLALAAMFVVVVALFALASSRWLQDSPAWTGWLARLPGGGTLLRVYRAVGTYRARPRTIVAAIGLSLLAHALNVAVLWHLARALELAPIAPADFAFCLAIGIAVSSFGLPLGIGIGQLAYGYMLSLYGVDGGFALATLQQVAVIFCNLAAGLPAFLLVRKDSARVKAEMAEDAAAPAGGSGV
jgi:hypothetical protein